jgi:L-threonylcarbamoyladenylate synthase
MAASRRKRTFADMITEIGTDLDKAERLLSEGALVAIPTETVYGLAANAFNAAAVLEIFAAKQRPAFDPLIVHVADRNAVDRVVRTLPPGAEELMDRFWPGPLTLILPKQDAIPDLVTSGLDTVGVRMPDHPLTRALLDRLPFPLAAPSANPFGYISPTTARHVADRLEGRVQYILDGGPCRVGVESTIVGQEDGRWVIYRQGGVAQEDIEAVIGSVRGAQRHVLPVAPGMLESHYAPHKPLLLGELERLIEEHRGKKVEVISFRTDHAPVPTHVLSSKGDPLEAAQRLFAVLRAVDEGEHDLILAEPVPDIGLGRAINDRLRRAAAKRGA